MCPAGVHSQILTQTVHALTWRSSLPLEVLGHQKTSLIGRHLLELHTPQPDSV